jgi:hypothetical protein
MKQFIVFLAVLLTGEATGYSQEIIKHAPAGFDSLRTDIPHGKIDTVSYHSNTVDTTRRASYIPRPVILKRTNTRCCTCYMVLGEMKKSG